MRRALPIVGAAAVVAVVAIGISQAGGGGKSKSVKSLNAAAVKASLTGAQAGRILGGGEDAFRARLAALRGHPVVVNDWASWCGPCRFEFAFFQSQGEQLGGRVAFLGVDTLDSPAAATQFLRDHPVPYPSYADPQGKIANSLGTVAGLPTTAFYDARGRRFVHQGGYASEALLRADIDRYAIGRS